MNELRMYVEHLFQGRVLTDDTIELKEEIYGNLVARYEDYVASGMDAAEALEQTKASITSIEDMLEGETAEGGAGAAPSSATAPDSGAGATTAMPGASDAGAAAASNADADAAGAAGATGAQTAAGRPVPPTASGSTASAHKRRMWPIVVGVVAGVIAIVAVASALLFGAVTEERDTVSSTTPQTQGTGTSSGAVNGSDGDAAGNGSGAGNGAGNSASSGAGTGQSTDAPVFSDPEDQREYEASSALSQAVWASSIDMLKGYAGTANATEVGDLAADLPLSEYRADAGVDTAAAQTTYITYTEVSDDIDGDVLESALLYNAVSILSVYPDYTTVRVSVRETGEGDWDAETYVFERAVLEHAYTNASDRAITQLNSSLFESQESWDAVRDYLFREHFRDRQIDLAETD